MKRSTRQVFYDFITKYMYTDIFVDKMRKASHVFSSPGRRPGRAIMLPLALALVAAAALAKSLTLKFFM